MGNDLRVLVICLLDLFGVSFFNTLQFYTIKFKKSDLTLIEINVICEVPFYFINKIIIDKII